MSSFCHVNFAALKGRLSLDPLPVGADAVIDELVAGPVYIGRGEFEDHTPNRTLLHLEALELAFRWEDDSFEANEQLLAIADRGLISELLECGR